MKCRRLLLTVLGILAGIYAVNGEDWPQWRGQHRNGISMETGLLKEWPADGPQLLWQARDIGFGYSTPAVVGDRIFLLSNEGNENEFVQALSVHDGSQIWSTRLGKVGNPEQFPAYPGSRSTPTVDGELLFTFGSDGDLACLETATGEVRWQKNVRSEFVGSPGRWAYSESPLVDGDVLVCTPGGTEATVVALNKHTGDVIWKCPVGEGADAAYASTIIVEVGGVKQYVQFLAEGTGLVGIHADTGELLWRYGRTAQGSPANIPTPVADAGYVYSATGRGGGGLVSLTTENGGVQAEQVYFSPDLPSAVGGAVLVGDYLYGADGEVLMCVEFATGEVQWQNRSIGAASLCYADGCLYLHGENGDVALLDATPDAYVEKGRFSPPNQPDRGQIKAWAYPVIAHGRLYIRDLDSLWCYDVTDEN